MVGIWMHYNIHQKLIVTVLLIYGELMFNLWNYFKFIAFLLLSSIVSWSFASKLTTSENRVISYTDVGEGKPIVLIHAFPTDQRLWEPQRKGLKQHFRIITLDLWGFGESSQTDGQAVTMIEYAAEIKELLDQLHIQSAIIGGESMGGYIALAFLEQYPEKVDGLILSNTQSIADSDETKKNREASAVDVLDHGTTHLIEGFMIKALSAAASEQTKVLLRAITEAQTPKGIASALRGMSLRNDTSNLFAMTTVPVLLITGEQDIVIPPQRSKDMYDLAKNSTLVSIDNAGHLSNLEQSEQWNQAVIGLFY